jgi:hypothetical protein
VSEREHFLYRKEQQRITNLEKKKEVMLKTEDDERENFMYILKITVDLQQQNKPDPQKNVFF